MVWYILPEIGAFVNAGHKKATTSRFLTGKTV